MKKKLGDDSWKEHSISFELNGKEYSVPLEDNLALNDLSVEDQKQHLNELPARLSYWKSLAVGIEREIQDKDDDFEAWFQARYMEVDDEYGKKTEGWKKSRVMLDNAAEYRKRKAEIRDLRDVASKINVLVTGYNTMTWTLREIAKLTYAEISNLDVSGKKSLADL